MKWRVDQYGPDGGISVLMCFVGAHKNGDRIQVSGWSPRKEEVVLLRRRDSTLLIGGGERVVRKLTLY
jgi:hypothetical protein